MTSTTPQSFLSDITRKVSLQDALNPCLKAEAELRRLFATERNNKLLDDPYVGLVDVYASNSESESLRLTQARQVEGLSDHDAKYVFPLKKEQRRATKEPAMATSLDQFRASWNIFTEGALSQLTDWNNVVAAGGAVLASLLPLPERARGSKRAIRKYFHEETYSTSDIDLFLYDLTPEQAEKKAIQIYEAVRDSVPWDTVCVRTKHAISIHSQFPYRSVQIILRLYKSPAEILAGFDIDCACFLYDGSRVMGNPRGMAALMSQANQVDMTRRSPSYEVRLAKYALRGFEVYVPNLARNEVDPTIFERSINRIDGLARLLVLEKLSDPDDRTKYLENRRKLRGRPDSQGYSRRAMRRRKKVRGDLKAAAEQFGGLSGSDYGTRSFHIPYGPGFDAKKVEKFIYGTDLGMNSTFNPKNKDRRLHRHPAFFGTMQEVMEDCCEFCPEPITEEEKELQITEDKQFVRGRVSFMEDDPGRQMMTGSFNPIDEGEWAVQAYLGQVEKLFQAIATGDKETVVDIVENGFDLKKRDHVGRTSLQLAIMNKNTEIANYLVNAGARITSRLVDGRTPLHLAAQLGLADVVRLLLERSKKNEIKAEEEKAAAEAAAKAKAKEKEDPDAMDSEDEHTEDEDEEMRPSSEDDWDSDEGARKKKKGKKEKETPNATVDDPPAEGAAIPEDNDELPDILDINAPDWDFEYSPLCHAIIEGHLSVVELLVRAGADLQKPFKKGPTSWTQTTFYPLTLTLLTEDQDAACLIAEKLLEAGASCTAADENLVTVFHRAVLAGHLALVRTFLRVDPNSKAAIDFLPQIGYQNATCPLVSAVGLGDRAMSALLIASGSKVCITEAMFDKSWDARQNLTTGSNMYRPPKQQDQFLRDTIMPVEASLASSNDLCIPLVQLGADLNLGLRSEYRSYQRDEGGVLTLLDRLEDSIRTAKKNLSIYQSWQEQGVPSTATLPSHHMAWPDTDPNNTFLGWLTATNKSYILKKQSEQDSEGQEKKQNAQKIKEQEDEVTTLKLEALVKFAKAQLEQLQAVEKEIKAHGGKTRMQLNIPRMTSGSATPKRMLLTTRRSTQPVTPVIPEGSLGNKMPVVYRVYRSMWNSEQVGSHLTAQYEQLFEACWKGDNHTIERLCLPSKTGNTKRAKDATYLQIAAEVAPDNQLTQVYTGVINALSCSFSTLAVAIMAKKWETAKVIIAIAKAQHEKAEDKPKPYTAPQLTSDDDDEEDDDAEMSVDSEDDVALKPTFIDLASRLSTVKTPFGPERLFAAGSIVHDDKLFYGTPIGRALQSGDLETIEKVLELGQMCEPAITLTQNDMQYAFLQDDPKMLEFIIRKFGYGFTLDNEEEEENEQVETENEGEKKKKIPKIYLGLNVQGRKRKDLATKGDPDAPVTSNDSPLPLIWQAAQKNSEKVLQWLATSGPLEAYKAYMQTAPSTDEHAGAMRRLSNFDLQLPALLGATATPLGENALFAHISGPAPKVDTIKLLFTLWPSMKTTFVHQRVDGLNVTPLLYICSALRSTEIFDLLLAQKVDPLAVDFKGCNILHVAAFAGNFHLIEHAFTKLSDEQLAILLSQETRGRKYSPLMVAVKSRRTHIVKFLLQYKRPVTAATLDMRDAEGSIPLHVAISDGCKEIAGHLIEAAQASGKNSLFIENGVGSTPLELARFYCRLTSLTLKNQNVTPTDWNGIGDEESNDLKSDAMRTAAVQRYHSFQLGNKVTGEDVDVLGQMVRSLDTEGRFNDKSKAREVLVAYVEREKAAAKAWSQYTETKERIQEKEQKIVAERISGTTTTITTFNPVIPRYSMSMMMTPPNAVQTSTDKGNMTDTQDAKGTYELIRDAVKQSNLRRSRNLVHLMDAQMAVDNALKSATKKRGSTPEFNFGRNQPRYQRRGLYRSPQKATEYMDMKEEDKSNTYEYLLDFSALNTTFE